MQQFPQFLSYPIFRPFQQDLSEACLQNSRSPASYVQLWNYAKSSDNSQLLTKPARDLLISLVTHVRKFSSYHRSAFSVLQCEQAMLFFCDSGRCQLWTRWEPWTALEESLTVSPDPIVTFSANGRDSTIFITLFHPFPCMQRLERVRHSQEHPCPSIFGDA